MALALVRRRGRAFRVTGLLLVLGAPPAVSSAGQEDGPLDLVAVGIAQEGRTIVLATPGVPSGGRVWRFRSLDTRELSQPIVNVTLAASGTKLFMQPRDGRGAVLDLTWQSWDNQQLQYVDARDLATDGAGRHQSHRLPAQRFISIEGGTAHVVDDSGTVQAGYPPISAISAAISDDGTTLYVRPDRRITICSESRAASSSCRDLPAPAEPGPIMISARSVAPLAERAAAPRFLLLTGIGDQTRVVDPEYTERPAPVTDRVEASLRAALTLHQISMSDARIASLVKALITESAGVQSAPGESIADWRFFRVSLDEHLYAPVLEFARRESVFPSGFEVAAELSRVVAEGREVPVGRLYERYLRVDTADRRRACTIHFRTRSTPGSWTIEYWFYYPFDVGGLGPHLHDPEHLFVEVDKLGSRVRRVNGRGTRVRSWQQPLLCR